MKICNVCGEEKQDNEFAFKDKKTGRKHPYCKQCGRLKSKDHYDKNKKYYSDRNKKRRKEYVAWRDEYRLNLVCEKCGENHPATLDFHHIETKEKEYSISQMFRDTVGKEKILEEINKCIILCSNCHRKLHWEEKNVLTC